jgi:hypothetical protein
LRKVILHYHFFKNAGTSVDEILMANFPGQWVTREFDDNRHAVNVAIVGEWVQAEKNAIAFSSHTAMLPPPKLEGVKFFPILFVRHPIDRIASAYYFERKQEVDHFGTVLARNTTLRGYIEVRLSLGRDRQGRNFCRNFQVARLAQMFTGEEGDETTLALKALNTLPFVGLVEEFDRSIERMTEWLTPHFPGFHARPVASNVTRDHSLPLEQKLERIKAEIGERCYARLLEANEGDMAVFNAAYKKLTNQ